MVIRENAAVLGISTQDYIRKSAVS
ncbi:hypothetical protein ACWGNN_47225 [Streptomyces sp. NPDC055817]